MPSGRIVLAIAWLFLTRCAVPSPHPGEDVILRGQAIRLTEALAEKQITADSSAIAEQIVLQTDAGELLPLLPDPASRALVLDASLRNRPVEIQARRYPGLPYLQVTVLRVLESGAYRIPEYYCDVCAISVRFPQVCPCCQGEMVFRYKPLAH